MGSQLKWISSDQRGISCNHCKARVKDPVVHVLLVVLTTLMGSEDEGERQVSELEEGVFFSSNTDFLD